MKLGANTVLFGGYDLETAFRYLAMAGYEGVELSAIPGMSEHLVVERWAQLAPSIQRLSETYGLELLAIEQPFPDLAIMEPAMEAAVALGIPIINCGPRGVQGDDESLKERIEVLAGLADMAESYGVTLCVKAHVGSAIYNTETTLRALQQITSTALCCDLDPSHIYRGGEDPVEAIEAVIDRIAHVHIRDCASRELGPQTLDANGNIRFANMAPEMQINGRGKIDLVGFVRVLHEHGYAGPLDLEIIGAKDYSLAQCCAIAAEAHGHMQACLQACGNR
jgi:sugar phosphate isomerase/epimerase